MMSASSDVESDLSRLKGEIATSAPKQLEGSNGNVQAQAQPASVPATELPAAEPQDGEP